MARTPKVVEDRREQILDAAMHVFAEKGFARATNKDVAREAGITPGLIYHYFESKEALLMAIVENRSPLKMVRTLPPEVYALPPEAFLRTIVKRVLTIVEDEHFVAFARMLLPEILNDTSHPQFATFAPTVIQRILGFLSGYIETKVLSGELRPIERESIPLYAQSFVGSIIAFVLRRQIIRDPLALAYSQEQIADVVVDMFLHGLLPS